MPIVGIQLHQIFDIMLFDNLYLHAASVLIRSILNFVLTAYIPLGKDLAMLLYVAIYFNSC